MPHFRNLFLIFSTLILVLSFPNAKADDADDRGPGESDAKNYERDYAKPSDFVLDPNLKEGPKVSFKCPTSAKTGEADPNCEGTTEVQPQTCQTCPTCKKEAGGLCDTHSFTDLRYEIANPDSANKEDHRGRKNGTTDSGTGN